MIMIVIIIIRIKKENRPICYGSMLVWCFGMTLQSLRPLGDGSSVVPCRGTVAWRGRSACWELQMRHTSALTQET